MSELLRQIRESVRDELRTTLFLERPEPQRPLPYDLEAEQELCAAVMDGRIKPSDLPIRGDDFWANIHGYVWAACDAVLEAGLKPTVEHVLQVLYTDGIYNAHVIEDVNVIAHMTPCISRSGLEARARRVRQLAESRRLIAELEQLAVELRAGVLSAEQARDRLSRALIRVAA